MTIISSWIDQVLCRPAELIAKYMDAQLKGGSKGQSDEEMESDLDKALMLFRYISVSPPSFSASSPYVPQAHVCSCGTVQSSMFLCDSWLIGRTLAVLS